MRASRGVLTMIAVGIIAATVGCATRVVSRTLEVTVERQQLSPVCADSRVRVTVYRGDDTVADRQFETAWFGHRRHYEWAIRFPAYGSYELTAQAIGCGSTAMLNSVLEVAPRQSAGSVWVGTARDPSLRYLASCWAWEGEGTFEVNNRSMRNASVTDYKLCPTRPVELQEVTRWGHAC